MSDLMFERSSEIAQFDKIEQSSRAEFLAVYGRRRIGKTYLINHYFKDKGIYFELTGVYKAPFAMQLENFSIVYSDLFFAGQKQPTPKNWLEAFTQLRAQIEKMPKDKKIILFFDELPWLVTPRSGFMAALDLLWNRYLSRMDNVILIVCGSAAAWMIKHVIHDKGGLHGRLTRQIKMKPFTLGEAEAYMQYRGVDLTRKQFTEIYMATGGVAKYLDHVQRGQSSAQIIHHLCFSREGYLYREFNQLYRSLFDDHEKHLSIVRVLAQKKSGFTRDELLEKTQLQSGGGFTTVLNELCESGFVLKVPVFGGKINVSRYSLADYYSLFYLKWIEPAARSQLDQIESDYWLKQQRKPAWFTWAGYSFENICLAHVEKIKAALGLAGVSTQASSWANAHAQIDLLIDRADHCINLCEIKFCDSEFVIDAEYAKKLLNKKNVFIQETKTKKAVFITLITTYGVNKNKHYYAVVDQQLTIDSLF